MGQNFIADTVNQTLRFPPSHHDWHPEGHRARFLLEGVGAGSERHLHVASGEGWPRAGAVNNLLTLFRAGGVLEMAYNNGNSRPSCPKPHRKPA